MLSQLQRNGLGQRKQPQQVTTTDHIPILPAEGANGNMVSLAIYNADTRLCSPHVLTIKATEDHTHIDFDHVRLPHIYHMTPSVHHILLPLSVSVVFLHNYVF